MGYMAKPNCIHIDNWRRCKVHKAHWSIRWMLPKGRPACVLDYPIIPQDGRVECAEFSERARPRPPGPVALKSAEHGKEEA